MKMTAVRGEFTDSIAEVNPNSLKSSNGIISVSTAINSTFICQLHHSSTLDNSQIVLPSYCFPKQMTKLEVEVSLLNHGGVAEPNILIQPEDSRINPHYFVNFLIQNSSNTKFFQNIQHKPLSSIGVLYDHIKVNGEEIGFYYRLLPQSDEKEDNWYSIHTSQEYPLSLIPNPFHLVMLIDYPKYDDEENSYTTMRVSTSRLLRQLRTSGGELESFLKEIRGSANLPANQILLLEAMSVLQSPIFNNIVSIALVGIDSGDFEAISLASTNFPDTDSCQIYLYSNRQKDFLKRAVVEVLSSWRSIKATTKYSSSQILLDTINDILLQGQYSDYPTRVLLLTNGMKAFNSGNSANIATNPHQPAFEFTIINYSSSNDENLRQFSAKIQANYVPVHEIGNWEKTLFPRKLNIQR